MVTPLIFLDVDGVLNHKKWFLSSGGVKENDDELDYHIQYFDPQAVANLNQLVHESGADIVISSTWRIRHMDILPTLLERRGLEPRDTDKGIKGLILGATPQIWPETSPWIKSEGDRPHYYDHSKFQRGMEIEYWLRHNRMDVLDDLRIVILDDDSDFSRLRPWHIKTSYYTSGLNRGSLARAQKRLRECRTVGEVLRKPHKVLTEEGKKAYLYT